MKLNHDMHLQGIQTTIHNILSIIRTKSQTQKKIEIPFSISISLTFFTFCFYLSERYKFGISDHNEQLPIIYRILNNSYLINDWFVNQTEGFSPRFFYSHFIAFFARFLDIELLFFIIFFIFTLLAIISIYGISWELFNNHLVSYLSIVVLLFGPHLALGGNWIFGSILVPSTMARGLALLAIYLFIRKKDLYCFILLGVAAFFQPLISLLTSLILLFSILLIYEKPVKQKIKKTVVDFAIYSLFGVWGFIPLLFTSSDISNIEIFNILTNIRHPHHFCPFSFPITDYVLFFLMLLLFIVVLMLHMQPVEKIKNRFVIVFTLLILFTGVIGTIFVEIIPVPLIGKLQLFKINSYIAVFSIIFIVNMMIVCISFFADKCKIGEMPITQFLPKNFFKYTVIICLILGSIFFLLQVNTVDENEDAFYQWIQSNTETEAIFLIPLNLESFRLESNRAIVVDWKAFPFSDVAIVDWYTRVNEVTNNTDKKYSYSGFSSYSQMSRGYDSLHEDDIALLKNKYHFDYVVVKKQKELNFSLVYSDNHYSIYQF